MGIVGLPNVGKSTLFNALLKRQQAYVANFPFATIEPNIGVVPVPDDRLGKLKQTVETELRVGPLQGSDPVKNVPVVPATCEFVDIAGLIAGAHKGEGLGNKFLAHIREANAICHVVRAFSDPEIVKQGVSDPKTDLEVVQTELALADFQTLEKQKDPGNTPDKELRERWEIISDLKGLVQSTTMIRINEVVEDKLKVAKELGLLVFKPILVCLNVDEKDLREGNKLEINYAQDVGLQTSQVIAISAKIESELSSLTETDQKAYLAELGVKESGLERLVKKAFATLGLITYLTAGVKEVRAWTIKEGTNAQEASGEIHTDFVKKFIKADIVPFNDFVASGGWKNSRDQGKVRSEGRDYIVKDGDVVEFKIGQ